MSEVHKERRERSGVDFHTQAESIYVEVSTLVHSEKVVPKSYRFTHALPLVDMARSMLYNINRAQVFYPNTAHNVQKRKDYLALAIADCEQISVEFGLLPRLGLSPNMNRFEQITDMIEDEIDQLRRVKNSVKLTGRESVEDRISDLEEQIEELRALL